MAGLSSKGSIAVGKDADLVIWRPEARADTASVFHRQPGSPYEDASLVGRVVATVLRGRTVFKDGQPPHAPCGTVLLRRGGLSLPVPVDTASSCRNLLGPSVLAFWLLQKVVPVSIS